MVAVGVHGQLPGHGQEVVPLPGLFRIVGGRLDALRLKDVGVVVDVRRDPAGADAEPAAVLRAAVALLGLEPVVRLGELGIRVDVVRDVLQHAVPDEGAVDVALDAGGVRRGARGDGGQQLDAFLLLDLDPLQAGVLLLEPGVLLLQVHVHAGTAQELDGDGFGRGLARLGGRSRSGGRAGGQDPGHGHGARQGQKRTAGQVGLHGVASRAWMGWGGNGERRVLVGC